jgi:dehydrogenase/reductase SDR family member 7B
LVIFNEKDGRYDGKSIFLKGQGIVSPFLSPKLFDKMDFYQNKRIWITGASSGIGESLAIEAAKRGAHLILSARNEAELHRVAGLCQGAASVTIEPLDLSKHSEIPQIVQKVLKNVGKIDILINNGGISQRSLASETALEVDQQIMNVNYLGTVAMTKAVLPSMRLHQLGQIATVSSLMGKFGAPMRSSYAASKHALHGFFESLRAELGDEPIKITMICPGFVRTNISINALTADGKKQGTMDDEAEKGMSPSDCARGILKGIEKGKAELLLGGREVLGVYLHRFFPNYLRKILRKVKTS